MQQFGPALKQRFDQVIFESKMMQSGFAALPYQVLKDKGLSIGARMAYAFLLMYGWQEGSAFAGQEKMAEEMGVSERQMQRYLYELRDAGYILVKREDRRFNNTYVILEKPMTKLKKGRKVDKFNLETTSMSSRTRQR